MIVLESISKSFPGPSGEIRVLDHLDLQIEQGEYLAITGPSGSGKSTLLNVLGLLDKPSAGRYLFEGRDLSGLTERERCRLRNARIGFVFQLFHLIPQLTVRENVVLPLLYSSEFFSNAGAEERAAEILERLGMAERLSAWPATLSGGERQRVAIARALINQPKIILADEPTGNLDQKSGAEVLGILRELSLSGQTIVVITHDMEVASEAGRRVRVVDGSLQQ